MGRDSGIEWTHHTFNPWWGCVEVSPECEHCYARDFSKRVGLQVWGRRAPRRFFGEKHWSEPLRWNREAERAGERHRVFCASMADICEDRRDLDPHRERLWALSRQTPNLDWLLLTKRTALLSMLVPEDVLLRSWVGTTAGTQKRADEEIPQLLQTPAAVRFLSCEPLLEAVDLRNLSGGTYDALLGHDFECIGDIRRPDGGPWDLGQPQRGIDWVIVGGESGPHHRAVPVEAYRSIYDQCRAAGVPLFVKQDSGPRPGMQGRLPDDIWRCKEFPA